jgi:hypothetical protein
MSTIKINVSNLRAETAPLYCMYPSQVNAQPAYIELGEGGEISASYSGEIGNAVPVTVWNGRDTRVAVSNSVSGDALADYLESPEFLELAEKYYAGHSIEWDGSNHIGTTTIEAQQALDDIEQAASQLDDAEIYDASQWLDGCAVLPELLEEGSVLNLVGRYECAADANQIINGNLAEEICRRVDDTLINGHHAREYNRLTPEQRKKLLTIVGEFNGYDYSDHMTDMDNAE